MDIQKKWLQEAQKAVDNTNNKNVLVIVSHLKEERIIPIENTSDLIEAFEKSNLAYRGGKLYKLLHKIGGVHASQAIEEDGQRYMHVIDYDIYIIEQLEF